MTAMWSAGEDRTRRWVLILVVAVAVLLAGLAGGAWWVQRQIDPPGAPGDEVAITVADGMSISDIGELLGDEGVVASSRVFRLYTRFKGIGPVQAGDYTLRRNESMRTVIDVLEAGPATAEPMRLTVPEGFTIAQVAGRVDELGDLSGARFLELAESGTIRSRYQAPGVGLEGFLLPETYFFEPDEDEEAVLRRMVELFDERASAAGIEAGAARLGLTPFEVVVVASLVEREARVASERPTVAEVIYNRLDADMLLQVDATIQYALGEQRESLRLSDLEIDSPYNTYKHAGLPPGPIASPGLATLEAALDPAEHDFLYYVLAEADGRHAFATTLEEHNRNVAAAREKGLL